ncbi:hypothetical protein [Siccirubricoccus phaeus]|uniref:hypothetical protein n=1 Tax=Siccirubricoccus phaeus TaxID=2595053 RepID=UPI0011F37D9E|nr:hypothetical protein [Siccirubricoccus phaeus]
MSDNSDQTQAPPEAPPPRNSPIAPPAPWRLDPAALLIGVGGVVLLLALWWLLVTPRILPEGSDEAERLARAEERLEALRGDVAGLDGRVQQYQALEARTRALEGRPPPPDLRPLESQVVALTERLAAADRAATERGTALDRRLGALESRPVVDPAGLASRQALETLAGRLDAQAADQAQRSAETREMLGQRVAAVEAAAQQKLAALEAQLGQRIAALEAAQQRLAAIEGRTARLAAVDALRSSLISGQPLGPALARIGEAPAALTRFANAPPPTEAGLRLSFEEAAKAARAASDAAMQPDGSRAGVVDSALARLGGLVTIRRGEQVVWGDAAEAEIERARRALEAGDVEMSLTHIEKLPPPARAAMQGWAEQARALLAARAALRQLAAG